MGGRFASREWKVCETYELTKSRGTSEGDADSYLVVPKYRYGPGTFGKWRSYEPLEETPDLFLKFARLYQAQDRPEAMLEWARTYGTLGHGQPPWVRGAPQDAKGFWDAVEQAAGLLALYEGVLNRDSQSVQRALLIEFPYVGIWWPIYDEPRRSRAHGTGVRGEPDRGVSRGGLRWRLPLLHPRDRGRGGRAYGWYVVPPGPRGGRRFP
jgi:hypothetical protein